LSRSIGGAQELALKHASHWFFKDTAHSPSDDGGEYGVPPIARTPMVVLAAGISELIATSHEPFTYTVSSICATPTGQ
jgi:hypothetical protein